MFEEKFPENLYHSYIIEGDPETLSGELISYLKNRKIIEPQSSNVLCQIYDGFTISDSPLIKSWHSERGEEDKKKICIIGAKFINQEAEHSLLKILEEPKENTHFFLILPNVDTLLPTILSRAHVIKGDNDAQGGLTKNITSGKKFLDLSKTERIDAIAKLVKSHDDDEGSASLRHDAINILNNLEKVLHERLIKNSKDKYLIFSLEEILKSREYLSLPGASVKMILEHIALVI